MTSYTITRFEEKSDALFICIQHNEKPVYIEHFFDEDERSTPETRATTIERLIAELSLMADEYKYPEPFISKVQEANALPITDEGILAWTEEIIDKQIVAAMEAWEENTREL